MPPASQQSAVAPAPALVFWLADMRAVVEIDQPACRSLGHAWPYGQAWE